MGLLGPNMWRVLADRAGEGGPERAGDPTDGTSRGS